MRKSLVLAALLTFVPGLHASEAAKPIKVRWLIAHEPLSVFTRATEIFKQELAKESNGQMTLEVLTPKDFGSKTGNMPFRKIFQLLKSGEVQLTQTLTTGIGEVDSKFFVLDLPFLFKSHEHASKVLDGKIGQQLFASLDKTKVRGLAFTYSGGFRVVPTTGKAINNVDDFKGMSVRTTNSPVAQETLRLLGARPIPMDIDDSKAALEKSSVDAAETTYVRINQVVGNNTKFINDTQHSLFLTAILTSSKFWGTLNEQQREILQRTAMKAAQIEREDSVKDGEITKANFVKNGVKVVSMTPEEQKKFEARVAPVYKKFENKLGKNLIASIKAAE